MTPRLNEILAEAAQFKIAVVATADRMSFNDSAGTPLAWMFRDSGTWKGYTARPDVSGRTAGRKATVAHWCLDYAANGF